MSTPSETLRPPAGQASAPSFDHGWKLADGTVAPFLSYVDDDAAVNWSDELEDLHEESSRDHFIDVWTRGAMLERLGAGAGARLDHRPRLLDRLPARGPRATPTPGAG